MADVFRGKVSGLSVKMYPGYAFHGVTAILALWLVMQAVGS
ncbi:MAG: hypothetical protein ACYC1C_15500 [Chloroflexota bacterium]